MQCQWAACARDMISQWGDASSGGGRVDSYHHHSCILLAMTLITSYTLHYTVWIWVSVGVGVEVRVRVRVRVDFIPCRIWLLPLSVPGAS